MKIKSLSLSGLLAILFTLITPLSTYADNTLLAGVAGQGAGTSGAGNYVDIMQFTAITSGAATEVHVYGGTTTSPIKVAVYSDLNNIPNTLLVSITGTSTANMDNAFTIPSLTITTGEKYWIGLIGSTTGCCTYSYPNGIRRYKNTTYSAYTFPSTWNDTGYTQDAILIHCGLWSTGSSTPPTINDNIIIGLGDSLTYGYPYDTTGSYLVTLQTLLGSSYATVNKGIIAEQTTTMVTRFQSDVINAMPEYVIIWGGTNDLIHSTDTTVINSVESNLQTMYTSAKSVGIRVIALTIPPFKGYTAWTETKGSCLTTINSWIATAQNVDYVIDTYALLNDPANSGTLLAIYDSGDHVHLNSAGYTAIGTAIYNAVWNTEIPPQGDGDTETRLTNLETRVTALENELASLQSHETSLKTLINTIISAFNTFLTATQ